MRRNKYLEDLGIRRKDYNYNIRKLRIKLKLLKQKRKYGFDETEVWNMDLTYIEWLYSHLMLYKETNHCDLNSMMLQYYDIQTNTYKSIKQSEALEFILAELKIYLKTVYSPEGFMLEEPRPEIFTALHLFADTFRFWWD